MKHQGRPFSLFGKKAGPFSRYTVSGGILPLCKTQPLPVLRPLQGQADGTLRLEHVSVDSDVKVGDIIVTSGIGGVFPKGLPLGTVSSVEKSANDVYYTIVVRAQTTAENNEEVLVITSLTDEQSASDEDVSTANSTPQGTSRDAATKTMDESSDDSSDTSETTDSGSNE